MKRIYSIAVATAILSAVGLSGAWFLSGPSAGANNSPGSSGINIEADSLPPLRGRCSAKAAIPLRSSRKK